MSKPTVSKAEIDRVRILQAEIDQLQANLSAIEQQAVLINSAINSLYDATNTQNELKTKKPGEDILIPIGGSNLILCTIKNPQETYISLGSGVTLLTDLEKAEQRNKNQIEKLENSIKELQRQSVNFSEVLNTKRQEFLKIAEKLQIL